MEKEVKISFNTETHKLQMDLFVGDNNTSRIVAVVRSDGIIYGESFKTFKEYRRKGYGKYLLKYFLEYIKTNYNGMTFKIYAVPFVPYEEMHCDFDTVLKSVPSKETLEKFYATFGLIKPRNDLHEMRFAL